MRSADGHIVAACGGLYAMLWLATALPALAEMRLYPVDAPHDALPATLSTAGELAAANLPVVGWPLALIALGWPQIPVARTAADAMIAGQLLMHGLMVGTAIGQHPQLWRYLPHLPLEWLALTVPAGAWVAARRRRPAPLAPLTLVTASLIAIAAAVETWAVPL